MNIAATRYSTGNPCPKGHMERFISNRACCQCTKDRTKQRRRDNPEWVSKCNATYRTRHPQSVAEAKRRWSDANPIKDAARKRAWLEANLLSVYQRIALRKRGIKEAVPITMEQFDQIWSSQGGRCPYCGVDMGVTAHREHKTPIVRGGMHVVGNLQWTCMPCNLSKGRKTHEEYTSYLSTRSK